MPEAAGKRRFSLIPLGVVILIGAVALIFVLRSRPPGPLPMPTSGCYEDMVSAFYAGTVALVVQDPDRPEPQLKHAIECVREEPAPWANLGLYYLRSRTRLAEAESALKTAQEYAPSNSEITALTAHLEAQKGRIPEAVARFQKAVEQDPSNVHARYWLATYLDRQRAQGYEAEFQKQMEGILKEDPVNLVALIELGRVGSRRGDAEALKRSIDGIEKQSTAWAPRAREALAEVKQVDATSAAGPFLLVTNLVRGETAYRKSLMRLTPPDNAVGVPLERFVRLPSPSINPAPPDLKLTFKEEAFQGASPAQFALYARLRPEVTFSTAESFRIPAAKEEGASLILADGKSVRVLLDDVAKKSTGFPFPGGTAARPPSAAGIAVADLNYDFRPDLALAGAGGFRLMMQAGDGSFTDATAASKLPPEAVAAPAYGVWIADTDLDGDLDLVVGYPDSATRVFRNNGDGTFKPESTFAGIKSLRGFAWADYDSDGDPDPAFLDSAGVLTLMSNERSGRFLPWRIPDAGGRVAAIGVADINRDLQLDLVYLRMDGALTLLSSKDDGTAWDSAEVARASNFASAEPGAVRLFLTDLDNNGGIDLLVCSAESGQGWLSDEKGGFAPLTAELGPNVQAVELKSGDDGLMDLIALNPQGNPVVRLTKGTAGYMYLDLRPRATTVARSDRESSSGDNRISTFGIGGEIEARSALLAQKRLIQGPGVHFGLGKNVKVDYARFIWPNGSVQGEFTINANQAVVAIQRLKGSCPWMFAWDGQRMAFVTDVLWKSPLGLRINAQDTAGVMTTEDWVKIRGDQLAPKDGHYDVRITAELWETHFFDHVSLLVVDHPENSEVFVDERFAFPPPPLKIHSFATPQPVTKATDDNGTDVTEVVRDRDGNYLDTFGRGNYQGITRSHWLEVEIPREAALLGNIALIGFGWVHPTDSSINVAISQGAQPPPSGLSIEVPDGEGWKTAASGLGFPAGKNKTVVLDLKDILAANPGTTRFRLRTNLELYWDSLQWAEWKPETEIKIVRLNPSEADLRYRGFSVISQKDRSSPELPDYDKIWTRAQMWRDLVGYYTRFGDVKELLQKVDDRYAILNAGDEMAFRFPEQPAPPTGWKRSFVLISDGWEKDGDYNTGFSKTVLPLPSHSDPKYASPPGRLEDDPVYRRYPADWVTYHTRWVSPDGFRAELLPRIRHPEPAK